MALSLRDKLKSVSVQKKAPVRPPSDGCLVRRWHQEKTEGGLRKTLPGDVMSVMLGVPAEDIDRRSLLFLDTETTGLSGGAGTVAFLVGVGYFDGDEMTVEQYLMRDYDEEAFVLSRVADRIRERGTLCTFNGSTFDLPLLENRMIMNRMRMPAYERHIDLVHIARRVWKLRLKKCNLTHLEEAVLGRTRQDDLPGAQVPERYFSFLKTGNMGLLEDVLTHNRQDIASLSDVLERLIALHASPLTAPAREDIFSLGRIYDKRGQAEMARKCYRAARGGSLTAPSDRLLAESLRRSGLYAQSAAAYERALHTGSGDVRLHIALAKIYEHKTGDLPAALRHTRQALALCAENGGGEIQDIQKRYRRILQKIRRDTSWD